MRLTANVCRFQRSKWTKKSMQQPETGGCCQARQRKGLQSSLSREPALARSHMSAWSLMVSSGYAHFFRRLPNVAKAAGANSFGCSSVSSKHAEVPRPARKAKNQRPVTPLLRALAPLILCWIPERPRPLLHLQGCQKPKLERGAAVYAGRARSGAQLLEAAFGGCLRSARPLGRLAYRAGYSNPSKSAISAFSV